MSFASSDDLNWNVNTIFRPTSDLSEEEEEDLSSDLL